ncbi:hypothetical protein BN1110_02372 [bacterium YEK0313]|nr:hypothetical protein BN1110_02372 [bacterium YEK0313]
MADVRRPELRSCDPTWQERIGGWLMGDGRALSPRGRLVGPAGLGSTGPGLVNFTLQASRDDNDGNYAGAAFNGLAAAGRGVDRGVARRQAGQPDWINLTPGVDRPGRRFTPWPIRQP